MLKSSNSNDIIGKKYTDLIHPDYHSLFKSIIEYSMENIMVPSSLSEIKIICSNGTFVDTEIRCVSFMYNGKTVILSIFRDITIRKNAMETEKLLKQALEHDKLITEFFQICPTSLEPL